LETDTLGHKVERDMVVCSVYGYMRRFRGLVDEMLV